MILSFLTDCVTPNMFECVFINSVVLSTSGCSLKLCSAASGVNSVQVVLSGVSVRLLSFIHVCNC